MREAAYKVYHYPNESQVKLLDALILNRHRLATLAGFPSFAHRALKGTLAETPGICTAYNVISTCFTRGIKILDIIHFPSVIFFYLVELFDYDQMLVSNLNTVHVNRN